MLLKRSEHPIAHGAIFRTLRFVHCARLNLDFVFAARVRWIKHRADRGSMRIGSTFRLKYAFNVF